jgi:hypothetical protein
MKTLKGIAASLAGLFVEDGALALAILVVVAAARPASGAILLFGCLGVLLLNVIRAGRR